MSTDIALVVGGSGLVGRALVSELTARGVAVVSVTRQRAQDLPPTVTQVSVDVLDIAALRAALQPYCITQVYYAALYAASPPVPKQNATVLRNITRMTGRALPLLQRIPALYDGLMQSIADGAFANDPQGINQRMLEHVLSVVQAAPHRLQHVSLVTGGKAYGMHLTPHLYPAWQTPFSEDAPRAPGPNFYYAQEDRVMALAAQGVSWNIVRPGLLVGANPRASFNILTALAVYAALCQATAQPLLFFGDGASADAAFDFSDADLVARMMIWGAHTPAAHGQAFNSANGHATTWRTLWPALGQAWGLHANVQERGMDVLGFFKTHAPTWPALVDKHDLQRYSLADLHVISTLVLAAVQDWDTLFDMRKARTFGFVETVEPVTMLTHHRQCLRDQRVIP
jgi:nucleoside-diphosphate-sugar epimerase